MTILAVLIFSVVVALAMIGLSVCISALLGDE